MTGRPRPPKLVRDERDYPAMGATAAAVGLSEQLDYLCELVEKLVADERHAPMAGPEPSIEDQLAKVAEAPWWIVSAYIPAGAQTTFLSHGPAGLELVTDREMATEFKHRVDAQEAMEEAQRNAITSSPMVIFKIEEVDR